MIMMIRDSSYIGGFIFIAYFTSFAAANFGNCDNLHEEYLSVETKDLAGKWYPYAADPSANTKRDEIFYYVDEVDGDKLTGTPYNRKTDKPDSDKIIFEKCGDHWVSNNYEMRVVALGEVDGVKYRILHMCARGSGSSTNNILQVVLDINTADDLPQQTKEKIVEAGCQRNYEANKMIEIISKQTLLQQ